MRESDPTQNGRYEPVTMLGEGGMARAYLAVSRGPLGLDKLVVVKQVRPELAWDRDFLKMFFDEARIAARLNHPNIVQTYEVVEDSGQYLLAMEYLEGQTLTNLLRRMGRANMPLEQHLFILTQVLSGLDYAHELRDYDGTALGVVHRDVCPSNVIVTYNGEVKLIDFGMARAAGLTSAGEKDVSKGKGAYGAPELFTGDHVDRRADIYSVGVMLWEALTRKRRNPAEASSASFHALLSGPPSRVREIDTAAPGRLADICDRALAADPIERYATAVEFLSDLEEYVEAHMRRIERRDLSSLMMQLFRGDRQEMAKRIEEQVGVVRTVPSLAPTGHSVSPSRAPTVIDLARHKVSSGRVTLPPDAERSWIKRNGVTLGVALAGVLALVVVFSRMKARSVAATAPRGTRGPEPPAPRGSGASIAFSCADHRRSAPAGPVGHRAVHHQGRAGAGDGVPRRQEARVQSVSGRRAARDGRRCTPCGRRPPGIIRSTARSASLATSA